jgi:hypothetical protein
MRNTTLFVVGIVCLLPLIVNNDKLLAQNTSTRNRTINPVILNGPSLTPETWNMQNVGVRVGNAVDYWNLMMDPTHNTALANYVRTTYSSWQARNAYVLFTNLKSLLYHSDNTPKIAEGMFNASGCLTQAGLTALSRHMPQAYFIQKDPPFYMNVYYVKCIEGSPGVGYTDYTGTAHEYNDPPPSNGFYYNSSFITDADISDPVRRAFLIKHELGHQQQLWHSTDSRDENNQLMTDLYQDYNLMGYKGESFLELSQKIRISEKVLIKTPDN